MVTAYSKSQVPLFLCDGKLTEYQLKSHDCLEGFSLLPLCPALPPHCLCLRGVFWETESQLQPRGFPEHTENMNSGLFPSSESLQNGSPSMPVSKEHGQGQLVLLAREMVAVGRQAAAFDHTVLLPSCCWWEEQAC